MPIYEYVCDQCGNIFDTMRSMKDADQPYPCKNCQSPNTHRKLSTFFAHGCENHNSGSQSCSCGGCQGGSCSGCHH